MKTIWKYPIEVTEKQILSLPFGARILTVQVQMDKPFIWAEIDSSYTRQDRYIYVFGTGHEIKCDGGELNYIGTFQLYDGKFMGHVYEANDISL